jgi:hypothetical protein
MLKRPRTCRGEAHAGYQGRVLPETLYPKERKLAQYMCMLSFNVSLVVSSWSDSAYEWWSQPCSMKGYIRRTQASNQAKPL